MMKKVLGLPVVLMVVVGLTVPAVAGLVTLEPVTGEFVVMDEDTNLMWTRNAGLGGGNWWNAITWAENLSYAGYDDWRLPHANPASGVSASPSSEMGHLFHGHGITSDTPAPFIYVSTLGYWTDTDAGSGYAWRYYFHPTNGGIQGYYWTNVNSMAWAVREVPEPTTVLLLGLGGVTLLRKRRT